MFFPLSNAKPAIACLKSLLILDLEGLFSTYGNKSMFHASALGLAGMPL
jgi:hypothetical protein